MALIAPGAAPRTARADDPWLAEAPPIVANAAADAGPPSRWMARLHTGLRWMVDPSAEQKLLAQDGYDSSMQFVFTGDFAWYVLPAVGLGAWADHSLRKVGAKSGGPTLTESTYAWGIEAPLRIGRTRTCDALFVPRIGYGWSFLDFGGHAEPVRAVTYGGDFAVLLPRAHLSFNLGYMAAPTRRPGAAGRDYNFGGFAVSIGGMIDG